MCGCSVTERAADCVVRCAASTLPLGRGSGSAAWSDRHDDAPSTGLLGVGRGSTCVSLAPRRGEGRNGGPRKPTRNRGVASHMFEPSSWVDAQAGSLCARAAAVDWAHDNASPPWRRRGSRSPPATTEWRSPRTISGWRTGPPRRPSPGRRRSSSWPALLRRPAVAGHAAGAGRAAVEGGSDDVQEAGRRAAARYFALKEQMPRQQPFLVALTDLDDTRPSGSSWIRTRIDPSGETTIDWFVPSPDGRLSRSRCRSTAPRTGPCTSTTSRAARSSTSRSRT